MRAKITAKVLHLGYFEGKFRESWAVVQEEDTDDIIRIELAQKWMDFLKEGQTLEMNLRVKAAKTYRHDASGCMTAYVKIWLDDAVDVSTGETATTPDTGPKKDLSDDDLPF